MAPRDPLLTQARGTRNTPQSRRIPGRADQVQNSAGGYVFALDDWAQLHRFLILGTTGGTYYTGERELTEQNAAVVHKLVREDGVRLVEHITRVSEAGDAPKQNPTLYALAIAISFGDTDTRRAAAAALPRICRTGYMLFKFVTYAKAMRGMGDVLHRAIEGWYQRDPRKVSYQAVKYRQREGWSHRDLLRLMRIKPENEAQNALFGWVTKGTIPERGQLPLIDAFVRANDPAARVGDVIAAVDVGLPWEGIPDKFLKEPAVWDALLNTMPATALLRNLPRLTRVGLIKPIKVIDQRLLRLTDAEYLKRARVHPVAVLNALMTYQSGRGKGSTWTPVAGVVDLLDDAFYAAFGAIEPTGKRTLLALDVSGSMGSGAVAGLEALTPREASAAMAMATARVEDEVGIVGFTGDGGWGSRDTQLSVLSVSKRQRLDDVVRAISGLSFGTTDCSLPMQWAMRNRVEVDTFVIYTDNETWAGGMHPTQALEHYRHAMGIEAREAVVGMTSTGFSIADPNDPHQLDLVGFDAAAPQILSEFARGNI